MPEEQPTQNQPPSPKQYDQSQLLGVSVRGWLAIMLTFTVCLLSFFPGMKVEEPLYSGFLIGLGFYLGTRPK